MYCIFNKSFLHIVNFGSGVTNRDFFFHTALSKIEQAVKSRQEKQTLLDALDLVKFLSWWINVVEVETPGNLVEQERHLADQESHLARVSSPSRESFGLSI